MHNGPSEASILRSMYEQEVKDHAATLAEVKRLRLALEHTLTHAAKFGIAMRGHEVVKAAL